MERSLGTLHAGKLLPLRTVLTLFCFAGVMFSQWCCSPASLSPKQNSPGTAGISDNGLPEKYLEEGTLAFDRGAFTEAIGSWMEASKLYESSGNGKGLCAAQLKLASGYQAVGLYEKALHALDSALANARKRNDRQTVAAVTGTMGDLYNVLGPEEKALSYLNQALAMAREIGDPSLSATILNNLGNLHSLKNQFDVSATLYTECADLAEKSGDLTTAAVCLTNAAMAMVRSGQVESSKQVVEKAVQNTANLKPSHQHSYLLINLGLAYLELAGHLDTEKPSLISRSVQLFRQAGAMAQDIDDPLALSYALGYLGKIYEGRKRWDDAMELTRSAISSAQRANSPESLYRWQWQAARLFGAQGKIEQAVGEYRNAASTFHSIQQEMSNCYGRPRQTYKEVAGPMLLEYVDLLLRMCSGLDGIEQSQPYLMEAREALESLKVFELRDYFHDDCLDAARRSPAKLESISREAAVVYPIILKDRTELLVSLPGGMRRYSVNVDRDTMTKEVREFRKKLEKITTREYLPHAQKLYGWLVRPYERELKTAGTRTLVFVPDGPLRMVPMAALHDGRNFLIENYSIAVTPGLNLTDPKPVERRGARVLAVGISDAIQGFPALPYVDSEIEKIQSLYRTKVLLNQEFRLPVLEKELGRERFTMVHIASHGQFEADVDKTFILAFDGKLTMDSLNKYIGLFRFREDPLDLLTLSACETAAGDDRAGLGLAGVAVKAGARSALATLWQVNDEAASLLVAEFYRQLEKPGSSRAEALRRAQLRLLEGSKYRHPCFWSPFLLINNWL